MKDYIKTNIVAFMALLIGLSSIVLWSTCAFSGSYRTTVGIIKINTIMTEYPGAQDARLEFQKKISAMNANVDTLRADLQSRIFDYEKTRSSLSQQQKMQREQELKGLENQVRSYEEAVTVKMQDENNLLMQGIINQVRTAAEIVGSKNGYHLILAVQDDGMLVYGTDASDATNEILAVLKSRYSGLRNR